MKEIIEKFTGYEPRGVMQLKMNRLIDVINTLQIEVEKLKLAAEPAKKSTKKTEE